LKAIRYALILLLLVQLLLPYSISLSNVYHNRIDYYMTIDNLQDINPVLETIKIEIDRKRLKDYIIILGDSVMYGSPGNSDQAVNVYMEKLARQSGKPKLKVFNLAFPSMQTGDFYTMLLLLDHLGISTDRLIFNLRYASFIPREPSPAVVLWMKRDLSKLDPAAFQYVLPQLRANGYKPPASLYKKFKDVLYQQVLPTIKLYEYKDYLHKSLNNSWLQLTGDVIPDDSISSEDERPWYEKEYTAEKIHTAALRTSFTDRPLDMTPTNLDIYFMDKILAHQQGKKTLVALTGTNLTLMKEYVEKPGYRDNLQAIDHYFQSKHVSYLNLEGRISDKLFTDYTHLLSEGYQELAAILWNAYEKEG
jgi:hypothetical protein